MVSNIRCVLGIAVLTAGCSRADHGAPADSPVAVPLSWQIDPRWAVGGTGDSLLQLGTTYADDIGADSAAHLWIIDRTESRVVEYDTDGNRFRALGRQGLGPGEFEYPASMEFTRTGDVRVYDIRKRAIVVFAADGTPRPEEAPHPRMRQSTTLANGDLVALRYAPDTSILRTLTNGEVRALVTFAAPGQRPIPDACSVIGQTAAPVFSPTLAYAVRGNRVVYSTGDYALTIYEPGKPDRILRRAATRLPTTVEMARLHLGLGMPIQIVGRPVCYIPTDMVISAAGVASTLPAYSRLVVAPDSRIWALRFTVGNEARFADIYDPDDGYQGTVLLGTLNPTTFLSDGSLVSLESDDDDVPVIVVYRVEVP